ncbi:MAG: hypothetical protein AB7S38_22925 [Vulcanimicrobiota bacterium]
MRWGLLFCLLVCWALPAAAELAGRKVVLVVTRHRQDPDMVKLEEYLTNLRSDLGLGRAQMPLVFMGFEDSSAEAGYFQRLGFKSQDAPVMCVAEWGDPERFGPKRVVDEAIMRRVEADATGDIVGVVRQWLEMEGYADKVSMLPVTGPTLEPQGRLQVSDLRFEANGKPLFLLNARVRLKNVGEHAVTGVKVEFLCRTRGTAGWRSLGVQEIDRIPGGYAVARDLVGDTRQLGLLDANQAIQPCDYRVRVVYGDESLIEEGSFQPRELQDQ